MLKVMARGVAVAAAGIVVLSACSSNTPSSSGNSSSGGGSNYKVGLLLPETAVARYEGKDKPYFTAELKKVCPACKLLYANANSDAAAQQQQAQSMLTQGVKVLVVDPVDGVAAGSIVSAAKARNVPVVAYDRLIHSPDLSYVISNDYEKVGELQGQALVEKLKADKVPTSSGGILMINGAKTDNNALSINKGAMSVIGGSGYKVLAETDTWDPAAAQQWVSAQVTRFSHQIVGIYSANDDNGLAAVAALRAAGVTKIPPITGLDASLAGLQAVLKGDLYMTTYNAFKHEAQTAADVAYELAQGKKPQSQATVDGHPASLNPPQAVTKDKIQSTVIADGFYTVDELCTAQYQAACQQAGVHKP
jgi:D-xylose transport system substrate-binding protein